MIIGFENFGQENDLFLVKKILILGQMRNGHKGQDSARSSEFKTKNAFMTFKE